MLIYAEQMRSEAHMPSRVKDCLFQLCPKFGYSAQEKMLERLKQYKLSAQTWSPDGDNSALSKEIQNELMMLHREESLERENNVQVINKSVGRTIDFGDIVQLKHVRSGNFLTVMRERAKQALARPPTRPRPEPPPPTRAGRNPPR